MVKEDLCTISGPVGRRRRWHEFLSRFNLIIEYLPGDENDDGDTLLRWAYPAGAAQDRNFHGGHEDHMGSTEVERKEKVAQEQILRERYPDAFGSCTAKLTKEQNRVTISKCSPCGPVMDRPIHKAPYILTNSMCCQMDRVLAIFLHSQMRFMRISLSITCLLTFCPP